MEKNSQKESPKLEQVEGKFVQSCGGGKVGASLSWEESDYDAENTIDAWIPDEKRSEELVKAISKDFNDPEFTKSHNVAYILEKMVIKHARNLNEVLSIVTGFNVLMEKMRKSSSMMEGLMSAIRSSEEGEKVHSSNAAVASDVGK